MTDSTATPAVEQTTTRIQTMKARDLDIIPQDRANCLVKRMFVMSPPKERESVVTEKVEVKDENGETVELLYRFTPMSAYDLRVLHAATALASAGTFRGEALSYSADDYNEAANAAWELVGGNPARFIHRWMGVIRTTKRQLAEMVVREGARPSGHDLERCYASLKRLSEVTIHVRKGKKEMTTRLINALSRDGDLMVIALNPQMMRALARTGGAFTLLSMRELRATSREATILLLNRLSTIIDPGSTRQFRSIKLEEYLWGDAIPAVAKERREERKGRMKTIRAALADLKTLGWIVEESEKRAGAVPLYKITRPALARTGPVQKSLALPAAIS